jgi:predicted DNA-binding protein (MmcQ/YjbR family)
VNADHMQQRAMEVAGGLSAVTHEHPFGAEWEVFQVVGRVCLSVTEVPGAGIVVVTCEPEHPEALRAVDSAVTPGYLMSERH